MYVILCGNPVDGFIVYGPFDTIDESSDWARTYTKNDPYCIASLESPKQPVFYMVGIFDDDIEINRLGPYNTLDEALSAQAKVTDRATEVYKCERIK